MFTSVVALGLLACGDSAAPPALPAPIGKYIAYIANDAVGIQRLYVVDSGVPNVAHELNAPLKFHERLDRFVVSPDGQRIAYVTYNWDDNREDLYFTTLATPRRAQLFRAYPDQGVAKVAFTADSQRYVVLAAKRGATPPVQLPPGWLFVGDPDDTSVAFSLHSEDTTTNFVVANDGLSVVHSGTIGMFRAPVASLPPVGLPAGFSGPFSADGDVFALSPDGAYLLASHFSIYAGPSDASSPTVELINGCCGAAQAGGISANDDASYIMFLLSPPFPGPTELRVTSRSTPGSSTLVTLPDPDYVPSTNPVMLPGTNSYVVGLVDPTQVGTAAWIGLYTGDAATAATPTLLGAANEFASYATGLDADDVLYFGTPAAGGPTRLRQANLATPGTLIDLATPPLGSGPDSISVCGNTVAFRTQGIPTGVWVATAGQANSGLMVLATTNGSPQVTCLP